MACLNPGDEIIVTDPSYANYMAFAISCGAVVKSVKTHIEDGFKLPPVEEFEKQITPKTRAILICNPNNPTGYLYSKQEMKQIRDIVKKYNLYLFSDEVYREFIYTKRPYISAFHLEGIEENVVLVDSVSKRYSECGSSTPFATFNRTNHRRSIALYAAGIYGGSVRRIPRTTQLPYRPTQPNSRSLCANTYGSVLYHGEAAC